MKCYVLVFVFSSDYRRVLLIEKTKPEWQAGKYNGLGGHIEPGETPEEAARREVQEESGVDGLQDLAAFAVMECLGVWRVDCYTCRSVALDEYFAPVTGPEGKVRAVYTMGGEVLGLGLSNIPWLIQMALDSDPNKEIATIKYVSGTCSSGSRKGDS